MRARTEPWMLVLMILVGAVIGSLLSKKPAREVEELFDRAMDPAIDD